MEPLQPGWGRTALAFLAGVATTTLVNHRASRTARNGSDGDHSAVDALELTSRLNKVDDLRAAATEILDKAIASVGAERATLFLVNDTGASGRRELSVCLTRGERQADHKEFLRALRITVDSSSIAGCVAETGKPALVPDAYEDARFNSDVDRRTGFRTRSIACVPLLGAAGEAVGVLQAINRADGGAFDQGHMRALEHLATVAGALVQRLRLVLALQEARRRASELLVLMRDIPGEAARYGTPGVVRAITRTAYRILRCERVTLLLEDPATGDLVIQDSKDATGVRIPRGKGVAGAVATSGQMLNVPNAHEDPRFDASVDHLTGFSTRTMLAAPIRAEGGRVAGVLLAINRLEDGSDLAPFGPASDALQAGGAVVEKAATRSGSDEGDKAGAAAGRAGLLPGRHVSLISPAKPDASMDGFNQATAPRQPPSPPPRRHPPGASSSGCSTAFPFTRADEHVMEALVGQAGVELSRASATQQLQRSRDVTASLLEVVHASAVESTLHGLVNRVIAATYRLLRVDRVSLFLVDPLRQELLLVNSADAQGLRLPVGDGLAGTAARTGRISNVADAYSCPQFDSSADQETGFVTRTVLTVPVGLPSNSSLRLGASVSSSSSASSSLASPTSGGSGLRLTSSPIAVLQAINKQDGTPFDHQDEEAVAAFSVEVALALKRRSVEAALLTLLDEQDEAAADSAADDDIDLAGEDVHQVDEMSGGSTPMDAAAAGEQASTSSSQSDAAVTRGGAPQRRRATVAGIGGREALASGATAWRARGAGGSFSGSSSSSSRIARRRAREREKEVFVSLLSYYDDRHASSRLHASVVLRRMSFSTAASSSWPEGLVAGAAGQDMDPSDPLLSWGWDIFSLWDNGSTHGENALKTAVARMLTQLSLLRRFRVEDKVLQAFVNNVRSKYHENPFHNWRHAVAVMQASFLVLCHTSASSMLTYTDIFACLIAALCHDIDHPGCSNGFLIATGHELALRHNDDAPLERHHSATAAALLQDSQFDVFKHLTAPDRKRVRKVMVAAILATDMSRHSAHVQALADRAAKAVAERQASMSADVVDQSSGSSGGGGDSAAAAAVATLPEDPDVQPHQGDVLSAAATVGTPSTALSPHLARAFSTSSTADEPRAHEAHRKVEALGRRRSEVVGTSSSLRRHAAAAALDASPTFDRDDEDDRRFLVESIVHTADLSGQAFPRGVAAQWAEGIIAEFQNEARDFARHGMTAPPFIANLDTPQQKAGCQKGFISAMVLPLWERMQDVLQGLDEPVRNLHVNLLAYEAEAARSVSAEGEEADNDDDNE